MKHTRSTGSRADNVGLLSLSMAVRIRILEIIRAKVESFLRRQFFDHRTPPIVEGGRGLRERIMLWDTPRECRCAVQSWTKRPQVTE